MRLELFFFANFLFYVSYINSTSTRSEEPGGSFSMGKLTFLSQLTSFKYLDLNFILFIQVLQTQVCIRATLNISICQSKAPIGSYH